MNALRAHFSMVKSASNAIYQNISISMIYNARTVPKGTISTWRRNTVCQKSDDLYDKGYIFPNKYQHL